jgi:glyoxylase I family protein
MQDTLQCSTVEGSTPALPKGFHHHSWVVADHERTRAFYEGILCIPLIAFWIERDNFQGQELVIGHAFYGLKDGSRLSFFNVEGDKNMEKFKSPKTEIFNHIALHIDDETQQRYKRNLTEAGLFNFFLDHGYCHSLYTMDPDGLRLEFAVDDHRFEEINEYQTMTARESMRNWIAGNRASNNRWAAHDRGNQKLE